MKDDSIEGIYNTVKECAVLPKSASSICVSLHNIRSTKRISYGIGKTLDVFKATTRFLDQGGGKRGICTSLAFLLCSESS